MPPGGGLPAEACARRRAGLGWAVVEHLWKAGTAAIKLVQRRWMSELRGWKCWLTCCHQPLGVQRGIRPPHKEQHHLCMVVLSTHLGVNNVGMVFVAWCSSFHAGRHVCGEGSGGRDMIVAFLYLKGPTGKLGKDFCKGM